MNNKKKRNLQKKLAKQNVTNVLERNQVTVIGQAILFLTGTSLGVAKKSYKAKGLLSSLLSGGQVIKVGTLFVIKKITAVLLVLSGVALIFGFYKKKKSLKPVAKHQLGETTIFPGLFSKPVKITQNEVLKAEYQEYKYSLKFWVTIKGDEKRITFKISSTDVNKDELINFFKRYTLFNLVERESLFG